MTKEEKDRSYNTIESTKMSHIDTVSPFSTKKQGPLKGGRVISSANDAEVADKTHGALTPTPTLQPQVLH